VKVLIVDDEPLARMRLVRLVEEQPGYTVVAEADNGEQAIAQCNAHSPDVVLMDIRMPLMDGLQAARHLASLDEPPAVIFCTAYDDYALDAFDANAVDYLLKPVNRGKLLQALKKAQTLNRVQLTTLITAADQRAVNSSVVAGQRSHISVKSTRGVELVPIDQVRYFLADHKYVTVYHCVDGCIKELLIDDPLKELEAEFENRFVRIHRNALVAVSHIQGLEKTTDGVRLKLADIASGPLVSRRHLSAVRALLQHL
jgi:two-component system response regulator AlgR